MEDGQELEITVVVLISITTAHIEVPMLDIAVIKLVIEDNYGTETYLPLELEEESLLNFSDMLTLETHGEEDSIDQTKDV